MMIGVCRDTVFVNGNNNNNNDSARDILSNGRKISLQSTRRYDRQV